MSDFLVIGGWTGRLWTPVKIVNETPEEFQIEALERVMLPGRGFLEKGQSTHVSKTVIKHVEAAGLDASSLGNFCRQRFQIGAPSSSAEG